MRHGSIATTLSLAALLCAASCVRGPGASSPPPGAAGAPAASGTAASGAGTGGATGPTTTAPAGPARVVAGEIRDGAGRALGLRGLNAGNAAKSAPYLPWQAETDLDRMVASGMNAFRLLVSWKAIEPSPGVIDAAYLDEVARRVAWCADRGIYVLLDMHQDMYAEAVGGNGAPDWAVTRSGVSLPPTLLSGMPWYVGYFKPDVMASFDAFWANRSVPATGRGLQDHYAAACAALAARFHGQPYVLGYDLMNEPFFGGDVLLVILAGLQADPALVAAGAFAALAGGGPASVTSILADEATLDHFLAGLEPPVRAFEQQKLMPFFDRVARAVRAVDPEHILFLEGTLVKFAGGRSFIRAPRDAAGQPLGDIVFAHHYYDPSMADGTLSYDGRRARAEHVLLRSIGEARAAGAGVLLGEWGGLKPTAGRGADYLDDYLGLFSELGVGGTYWAYEPGFPADPLFPVFAKPYAAAVAGGAAKASFDAATGRFRLSFAADPAVAADTVVWLPPALFPTYRLTTTEAPGTYGERFDAASSTLRYRSSAAGPVTIEVAP